MENKYKSHAENRGAFPETISVSPLGDIHRSNEDGMSVLQYAVIHNMPDLSFSLRGLDKETVGLNGVDKLRIKATIEACRYALKALEESKNV